LGFRFLWAGGLGFIQEQRVILGEIAILIFDHKIFHIRVESCIATKLHAEGTYFRLIEHFSNAFFVHDSMQVVE